MSKLKQLKQALERLDVEATLNINQGNLVEEFAQQAALYAFWSQQLAEADRVKAAMDNEKDMEYAIADRYYRQEFDAAGQKYTEAVVKAAVTADEAYQQRLTDLRDAEYVYSVLRGLLKALDMRASMLISLGATLRQEHDMTGMVVREKSLRDTVAEVQAEISKAKQKQ